MKFVDSWDLVRDVIVQTTVHDLRVSDQVFQAEPPLSQSIDLGGGLWAGPLDSGTVHAVFDARSPRFASVLRELTWEEKNPPASSGKFPLPVPRPPLRLDLHYSDFPESIVAETAPFPLRRFRHQSALHRVAMHVSELDLEFLSVTHVSIVIPFLPERAGPCHDQ
jgi:hypothetical protein